jgi:hypothetical protein
MLSSSHPKIHEPPAIGVSPRLTDQRQRQKTAKHEGFWARRAAAVADWPVGAGFAIFARAG